MNKQPICDHPVNGSMETAGGWRLCCNPKHQEDPTYKIGGPVWHNIQEWDSPSRAARRKRKKL